MNLFAYGILMCEDILKDVSGICSLGVPAMLQGYCRRPVRGQCYPALVPEVNCCVEGIVYQDVPDSAWERLDRFEGEMYVRRIVQIEMNDGVSLPAATYVVKPEYKGYLEEAEWDFERFLGYKELYFEKFYKGYRSL